MLHSIFKVFFRLLKRNKVFYTTSFILLMIGISSWNILWGYIIHELGYDEFHLNKDRIFRIQNDRYKDGEVFIKDAATYPAVGQFLMDELPGIESYVRLMNFPNTVSYEGIELKVKQLYYTDPSFFSIFSFPLISGNKETCLQGTGKVVISKDIAKKVFGEEDPIGKEINAPMPVIVSGVFENNKPSHLDIDILLPMDIYMGMQGDYMEEDWYFNGFYTYLLLDKNLNIDVFPNKLEKLLTEHIQQIGKAEREGFTLQRLTDIHLHSQLSNEVALNGNYLLIILLSIIAFLILLTTTINYASFLFVKSLDRLKEIGLRRIFGSGKRNIAISFFVEFLLQTIAVFIVSIFLIKYISTAHNDLLGLPVDFFAASLSEEPMPWILITLTLFSLFGLALLYPVQVLNSSDPITSIKGNIKGIKGHYLRKWILVVQMAIFGGFLYFSIQVIEQVHYIENRDLGFELSQTLVVDSHMTDSLKSELKGRLEMLPEVEFMTNSSIIPGKEDWWKVNLSKSNTMDEEVIKCDIGRIDEDFINVFGMELIAGRNLMANEVHGIILNEKTIKGLGYLSPEEIIGEEVSVWNNKKKVVGVIKNYHHSSLKSPYNAIGFIYQQQLSGYYSINLTTKNMNQSITAIENIWKEVFPLKTFNFFFLDDSYNQQYRYEQDFIRNLFFFAMVVFVLVLTGIASFLGHSLKQRRKEIAIRKVLGGSSMVITSLFLRHFVRAIILAIIISLPLTLYASNLWMDNYAFKTEVGFTGMLFPYLTCFILLLTMVGFYIFYSSQENPALVLKEKQE